MASEKRSRDRERERQEEIADEFREAQLEETVAASLGDSHARTNYQPERFARPSDSRLRQVVHEFVGPHEVPESTRFAAMALTDALAALAGGDSWLPRLVPSEADVKMAWSAMTTSRVRLAGGGRVALAEDHDLVCKMFRAMFGVPPECYWELVLERALRDALALRYLLPAEHARLEALGRGHEVPELPTATDVLAVVREQSLPGTVPDFLTAKIIAMAFEQCTDADRGGGRGNAKKISVSKWIAGLKLGAQKRKKKTRARK